MKILKVLLYFLLIIAIAVSAVGLIIFSYKRTFDSGYKEAYWRAYSEFKESKSDREFFDRIYDRAYKYGYNKGYSEGYENGRIRSDDCEDEDENEIDYEPTMDN